MNKTIDKTIDKTIGSLCLSLALLVASTSPVLAQPSKQAKCAKYKTKLENIQSKQRQPNSVKRSNKLKEQALNAFKKWRKCQQGKLKPR
ncbi:hypothetical protein DXX93_18410 [Thalassotalea euphylliae]|uniref:Phosphate starvation-inducible protein PsiF n=1 Tax=Thalassotalea euphylliae TaxID=1655234 RepID=A0A3E0TV67_9GAMM|nr:hypothetical protein [Thalassotalea euphylliae]REL28344.1 hypothetical protein DXX93_18410 [Thalassotalea euphylliae]